MSSPLLIRAFVSERLTAAAEEIFRVFERTIERYEEEACSSKQENQRLRAMLLEVMSKQKTDLPQSPVCKEEPPAEQSLSIQQDHPEHPHIKEEAPDHWTSQGEEEQAGEFRDADLLDTSRSSPCEHEETKLPSMESCESDEKQEAKTAQLIPTLVSNPPLETLVQTQCIQGEEEYERLAPDQMEKQQSQTLLVTSKAPTELPHVNSRDCQCYLCNKPFSSGQHLINHAFRMHAKDAGVLCAVCGETLESAESLKVHLQSHKGSKSCHICGKQCTSMTSLTEHMASHAGVKLHRCHVCGKECSRKGDLKIHMRIHTGEKPFCCSFCGKSFTHSGHLRKHLRSHTGERPHRCNVCGRGFLQSAHLKYHLGTHTQKY